VAQQSPQQQTGDVDIIRDVKAIDSYLRSGCKPRDAWRIGTEHEKFPFHKGTLKPVAYRGKGASIENFLHAYLKQEGGEPIYEDGNIIAIHRPDFGSISLEPGGQIEFSAHPVATLHHACRDIHRHIRAACEVASTLDIGLLGLGFLPLWQRDDVPWMPKRRYDIMRQHMVSQGRLGIDMMKRTCTVQVNLDFASEGMMKECMRIGLALQPLVVALFANSPFSEGRLNGFLSYRSHVWTDTDHERCGILPFVYDDDFGFSRYRDYLLDVPMYFVRRGGTYHDVRGRSFRDFIAGRLAGFEGTYPTLEDVKDHMSTIFTEVRLKTFIEMRGADGGTLERLCALSAFWVGLLYDDSVRQQCLEHIHDWSMERHRMLRHNIPKDGLRVPLGQGSMAVFAREILALAVRGLKKRGKVNSHGQDESIFLEPLQEYAQRGVSPADDVIGLWQEHKREMRKVYEHFAY